MVTERLDSKRYPETFKRDRAREKFELLIRLEDWVEKPDREFEVGQKDMDSVNYTIVNENKDMFREVGQLFRRACKCDLPVPAHEIFATFLKNHKITPIAKVKATAKNRKLYGVEFEFYMLTGDFEPAAVKVQVHRSSE